MAVCKQTFTKIVDKTNFILFGNRKNIDNVCISMNNSIFTTRVRATKFLGVIIDEKEMITYLKLDLSYQRPSEFCIELDICESVCIVYIVLFSVFTISNILC